MNGMLSEDDLTRLLGLAAQAYEVPAQGPGSLLEELDQAGPERPLRRRRGLLLGTAAAALVAVALVAQGVGGSGSPTRTDAASTPAVAKGAPGQAGTGAATNGQRAPVAPAPAAAPVGAAAPSGGAAAVASGAVEARVVKTGTVALLADHGQVGVVAAEVEDLAVAPAYVASESSQPIGSDPSATLTLRVPAATFATVLGKVQHLGAKVVSVQSSGRDVTAAYVDTEAQIASLTAAKARYLTILSGARTTAEILDVQQRVDDVQGQIDRLEGQRRVLADQSDLATLTVTVTEKAPAAVEVAEPRTGLPLAWDRAKHGFSSGVEGLVAHSGRGLLVLLVGLVLLGLGRLGWRLARRQLV